MRCKVTEVLFTVKDTFRVDCSSLNLWIIDRAEWQKGLAEEARRMGCVILERTPVSTGDLDALEKEFSWVVDASGATGPVRKEGALNGRFALTAQYTLSGDFSSLYGRVKAVVEPHYCGYYWIFPKSTKLANVGVGWFGKRESGIRLHQELQRILKKEGLDNYTVLKKSGGPIPVRRRPRLVTGKTLIIGDAAGLASPLHGGGIDTACISGILAARAAAAGDPDCYEHAIKKLLDTRLQLEQKVLDAWEKLDLDELNELMAMGFGRGPGRFARLLKYRGTLLQEAAILRYVAGGHIRADWDGGLNLDQLPAIARLLFKKL
jgi:digeranylgeranylglycerophospholipid reductase